MTKLCLDCGVLVSPWAKRCVPCRKTHKNVYKNAWQKAHPEARYYRRHPDRASEAYKRRYNADPERHLARSRKWMSEHHEYRKKWNREYARRMYALRHPRPTCEALGCTNARGKWAKKFCVECARFYYGNRRMKEAA